MTCNHCGEDAELVGGNVVYPHRPDLAGKRFWLCRPCNAYCGCHPGTTRPLGTLATAETRKTRSEAHEAFDGLWKKRFRGRDRSQWYAWLAERMDLTADECHIGSMDAVQCRKVTAICWDELVRNETGTSDWDIRSR